MPPPALAPQWGDGDGGMGQPLLKQSRGGSSSTQRPAHPHPAPAPAPLRPPAAKSQVGFDTPGPPGRWGVLLRCRVQQGLTEGLRRHQDTRGRGGSKANPFETTDLLQGQFVEFICGGRPGGSHRGRRSRGRTASLGHNQSRPSAVGTIQPGPSSAGALRVSAAEERRIKCSKASGSSPRGVRAGHGEVSWGSPVYVLGRGWGSSGLPPRGCRQSTGCSAAAAPRGSPGLTCT